MTGDALDRRWADVAPLLDALAPLSAAEREARLAAPDLDAELVALARRLLAADAAVGAELEDTAAELRTWDTGAPEIPHIAGYRVLRFLGAGGMASVFLAERELAGT